MTAYRCPFPGCSYVSNSVARLRVHVMRAHAREKRCPVCGAKLNSFGGLKRHCSAKVTMFNDRKHLAIFYLIVSRNSKIRSRHLKGINSESYRLARKLFSNPGDDELETYVQMEVRE